MPKFSFFVYTFSHLYSKNEIHQKIETNIAFSFDVQQIKIRAFLRETLLF